jgi:tungstate transport system substrate-binding protein
MSVTRLLLSALIATALCSCSAPAETPPAAAKPQTIRCAVIGGLADTGFWQELGERFQAKTGHRVELAARGPRREIDQAFLSEKCHLIAMHASDTVINLVADGHAADPQPWGRNDFVLVGPTSDPAGVRGMTEAGAALRKIIESGAPLLVHSSNGAMEVLREVMEHEKLEFPANTIVRLDDRHRQMLMEAGEKGAYTLVGRIPFRNGKIPKQDLEVMVQGDPKLRRPYVVAVAAPGAFPAEELAAARELVAFLRSEETQA